MKKVWFIVLSLILTVTAVNAQDNQGNISIGIAFSGPVYGATLSVDLSEKYSARIIYSGSDLYQGQIHYHPSHAKDRRYIFGVGRLFESTYLRGAIGKNWHNGPWTVGGELGLNVPLDNKKIEEPGLLGALEKMSYLILFGVGLHYEFK